MQILKLFSITLLLFSACSKPQTKNELSRSPSLYIQEHANDPVQWHIWSDSIWLEAKKQKKLVLLSIGYSACHWCHVMQKESFQNKSIAATMNKYYFSVKIDREQFPEVDNYYAQKQEQLKGWAGWPMHFILNSNNEIIWTGIYLKPEEWNKTLKNIANSYAKDSSFRALKAPLKILQRKKLTVLNIDSIVNYLLSKTDKINGGFIPTHYNRKYPNVNVLNFLLENYCLTLNKKIASFIEFTAKKMALGGINDQIEGGFFRFSMDSYWHIPHFEKMLYTNAQLTNFYANAYLVFGKKLFKQTALNTANFILRDFKSTTPLFYSSMNADQETEGSYYIYTKKELQASLSTDFSIAKNYYNISPPWMWQNNSYHLHCLETDSIFALHHSISYSAWLQKKENIKQKLLKIRKSRKSPSLDPKLITSWNALLLQSFTSVYKISLNKKYLKSAQKIAHYYKTIFQKTNKIQHFYLDNSEVVSKSYPEDYLYLSKALIKLYEIDFDKSHLDFAYALFNQFKEKKGNMFNFPENDKILPSVAACENDLSEYFNMIYRTNTNLLQNFDTLRIIKTPENYSSQLSFWQIEKNKKYELLINGDKKLLLQNVAFLRTFYPGLSIFYKSKNSRFPILKDINYSNDTLNFYLCTNGYCMAPTNNYNEILKKITEKK